jgi:hypothetical protein
MFLIDIITSKVFLIQWLFGIICVEYALLKTKPVRKVSEERDSKYPAFRRYDVQKWHRPILYLCEISLTC